MAVPSGQPGERGVTVAGRLPVPNATPADGTAHDIGGSRIANPDALESALGLAVQMASEPEMDGHT